MSRPEPTSNFPEVPDPDSDLGGGEVEMYMASGPEECAEGYYWDGVQCVRKPEIPE